MNGDTTVNDVTLPRKTPLLCHVTDPEDKHRIIGDTFMRVVNKVIKDLSLNACAQLRGKSTLIRRLFIRTIVPRRLVPRRIYRLKSIER